MTLMVPMMKRFNMSLKILVVVVLAIVSVQVYLAFNVPGLSITDSEYLAAESVLESSRIQQDGCSLPNETVSAIKRAKTQRCQKEFEKLACDIQQGKVYPKKIVSSCPRSYDVSEAGLRVGCFKDSSGDRILKGTLVKDSMNHPDFCVNKCLKFGFEYAGLQYGVECFCGNVLPLDKQIDDSRCDQICPGNEQMKCGGYLTMDVYLTGLKPLLPPKTGLETVHDEDRSYQVGVVFLLTLNGRAYHQVLRLMERLDGAGSFFYIHVDARQTYLYQKLSQIAKNKPNVRMATKRFTTIWGGSSLLTTLLSCMQHLLQVQDWKWHFVLNLSESDYLVKTRDQLFDFLSANRDSNFVKSHGRTLPQFIKKQGLDRTFYQCEDRMWRLGHRELPAGIQWDGGSDWICLNRQFSEYVVTSNDTLITDLRNVFNLTLLPAESFFHVALRNSRFCGSYINNNLHLTNWNRKQGCKCQTKAVVDWCGCSPNDFLREDWNRIEATRTKQVFFARKFEPIIHNSILNKIDDWLGLHTWQHRDRYWQSVYSRVYDKSTPSPEFFMLFNFLTKQFLKKKIMESQVRDLDVELNEVFLFKLEDILDSIIVDTQTSDGAQLQLRIKLDDQLLEDARLVHLSAGTDFDLKEQIFRNFIRLFTTQSGPKLRGRAVFAGGKTNETYHFSWLDPTNKLMAVNHVHVDVHPLIAELDPGREDGKILTGNLVPGVWRLVATHTGAVVYTHRFLVLPQVDNGKYSTKASEINKDLDASNTLEDDEEENESVNTVLESWLEKYVSEFYQVSEYCAVKCEENINCCSNTSWSSYLITEHDQKYNNTS